MKQFKLILYTLICLNNTRTLHIIRNVYNEIAKTDEICYYYSSVLFVHAILLNLFI